jgi:hypothetical protein
MWMKLIGMGIPDTLVSDNVRLALYSPVPNTVLFLSTII